VIKWENTYLYLFNETEESVSDLESDSDNEPEDRGLLDAVVNDKSEEDDIIQDFTWEDMENYKEQGKFHGQHQISMRCKTCDKNCVLLQLF
jgi:hypothetical protein